MFKYFREYFLQQIHRCDSSAADKNHDAWKYSDHKSNIIIHRLMYFLEPNSVSTSLLFAVV